MTFATPWWLWGLLLLPLLWWLQQPPKPRRRELTAHLQQWNHALQALRRRPPRASPLRLLLLAIALAAVTFAAAGPAVSGRAGPDRLVVLLDASQSMAAGSSGAPAFDGALAALRERFATIPEHVEVTVLRCGGELARRHGASARSLHDLGRPEGELLVDLPELAQRVQDERTAVWTLSDGQGARELPAIGALTCLSTAGGNAAVVAVRIDDMWPLPELRVAVDVVAHARADVASATLRIDGAVASPAAHELALRRGEVHTETVELVRSKDGGALRVAIELPGDVLAADDARVFELPPLPAPRIAVLQEGDAGPFAAVAADALASEVGGQVVPATTDDGVGLLLVDGGVVPIEPGSVRALTFGTRLGADRELTAWPLPTPIDWSRQHPLTRGLDLSELRIETAWRDSLPDGVPFLWCDEAGTRVPLGVVVAREDLASVHLAFRLQDANLPLLAAFPQLLRRAFVHCYGAAAEVRDGAGASWPGERDLLTAATAEDRALPAFAEPPRSLTRWAVLAGLLALALRALVR